MITLAVAAPRRDRCGIADYARCLADAMPADFRLTSVDFPAGSSARAWRAAGRKAERADLIHLHYEYGLFGTVKPYRNRFATFLNCVHSPSVVTLHDALPSLTARWADARMYRLRDFFRDTAYLPFFRQWEDRQYRRASHWIVHTPELAEKVSAIVGRDRVSRIVHPVPATSQQWDLDVRGDTCLVTPGFIKRHKGYEDLLAIVASHTDWRWMLAGGPQDTHDRQYVAALQAEIRRRGIEHRVEMTGYLAKEELEHVAVQARLAFFPFRWASSSASIGWAIGMGLPIVATDLLSIRSLVSDGAGVELVPAGQPEHWGSTIAELLADPNRLASLARMNVDYAQRHGYATCAAQMAAIFRRLRSQGDNQREGTP